MFPFNIRTILRSETDEVNPERDDEIRHLVLQELQALDAERADMTTYRNYYDSEQGQTYGSAMVKEALGEDFKGFKDNWCGVVADALIDRLKVIGISIGEGEEGDDETANEIWRILGRNNFDEQQLELFEAAVVEGKGYVVVWPDENLTARVDWLPPQVIRIRYADDDERVPVLAVHRWVTPAGEVWVNVYTPESLFKYKQAMKSTRKHTGTKQDIIPDSAVLGALQVREVEGEEWPLPNPLGIVPVVELRNKRGSELKGVIPQQDALNYLVGSALISTGFSAIPQRVMHTAARAPQDGWQNVPGQVWRVPPTVDGEGRMIHGSIDEFSAADLSGFRGIIDMMLQHLALSSKTPVRYFFQSDRGGRGDAPSGESLKVEDGPLNSKTEDRQMRFGNSLATVAKMVKMCMDLGGREGGYEYEDLYTILDNVEVVWQAAESHYRLAVLQEAVLMTKLGIPAKYIWRTLGLTPAEYARLLKMAEEDKAEKEAEQKRQMDLQSQAAQANEGDPENDSAPTPASTSSGESTTSSSDA